MRLSDRDLKNYLSEGIIKMSPSPDLSSIKGVSVDLRLGHSFRVYSGHVAPYVDLSATKDQLNKTIDSVMGKEITISDVMQPKIEAEIAFVLKEDLNQEVNTSVDVIAAIDYVAPALEIVGSRIKNWDIKLADTIADNGSSGLFVLGEAQCSLDQIDLAKCEMELRLANEGIAEKVSTGSGAACMGNPLNAVLWLANTLALTAYPLRAGDIILSGALGPMVAVNSGDQVEAHISGLGSVSARFSA